MDLLIIFFGLSGVGSGPEPDAPYLPLQPGLDSHAAEGPVLAGLVGDGGVGVGIREPALHRSPGNAGIASNVSFKRRA